MCNLCNVDNDTMLDWPLIQDQIGSRIKDVVGMAAGWGMSVMNWPVMLGRLASAETSRCFVLSNPNPYISSSLPLPFTPQVDQLSLTSHYNASCQVGS